MDASSGVATMYRTLERVAASAGSALISLVCCQDEASGAPRLHHLRSVATLPLPPYPGRSLAVPSVLDVLDHRGTADYDVVHIAALFAEVTHGIPVVGAYHTEFAAYARTLFRYRLLGDLVESLLREFFRRIIAMMKSDS